MFAVGDTPMALSISLVLYLLVVGPFLAGCLRAVRRKDPDAFERAATDVQRFIDLRERAHAELGATGSLDGFAATKAEARRYLWHQ